MDTTGVINSEDYIWNFMTALIWSSHLDPTDGVMWDISPTSIGNRDELPESIADYPEFYNQMEGGTTSPGHAINPATGQPYAPNMVPRADYARVLAEFWADGPDSETPPGHWFTILNYVSDHEAFEKKFMGEGPVLDDLEWDVKSYFMLGGAMHDAAVSTWGIKGWYDYLRPISAIRAMASRGQSSDPGGESYHPAGVPLVPGYVEVIAEGDPLAGNNDEHLGEIKIKAWRGHNAINNVDVDEAGVGWILASTWEPYQRPSFVTPPFAGYILGHSTFSRAAAEVLTALTGDEYFPGGMGVFVAEQDEFLVFEDGPSVDVELQWATYQDAADESGLSRIWGGIHPPCDDIPGRQNGIVIGQDAFAKAVTYFNGCQPIQPPAGNLQVSIDLECVDSYTIELYEPGTTSLVTSESGSIDPDNNLTATDLPAGTYDVFVKLSGYLKKGYANIVIDSGDNSMTGGSFIQGDLNDDNSIDIQDFSIFSANYGRSLGDPDYNPAADLNCDDTVDIIDFSVFSSNLGLEGDEPPFEP
jgi:hypothetical protein